MSGKVPAWKQKLYSGGVDSNDSADIAAWKAKLYTPVKPSKPTKSVEDVSFETFEDDSQYEFTNFKPKKGRKPTQEQQIDWYAPNGPNEPHKEKRNQKKPSREAQADVSGGWVEPENGKVDSKAHVNYNLKEQAQVQVEVLNQEQRFLVKEKAADAKKASQLFQNKTKSAQLFQQKRFSPESFVSAYFSGLTGKGVEGGAAELHSLKLFCDKEIQACVYEHHNAFLQVSLAIPQMDQMVSELRVCMQSAEAVAQAMGKTSSSVIVMPPASQIQGSASVSTRFHASLGSKFELDNNYNSVTTHQPQDESIAELLADLQVAVEERDIASAWDIMVAGEAMLQILKRDECGALEDIRTTDVSLQHEMLQTSLEACRLVLLSQLESQLQVASASVAEVRSATSYLALLAGDCRAASCLLAYHSINLQEQGGDLLKYYSSAANEEDGMQYGGCLAQRTFLQIGAAADDMEAVFGTDTKEVFALLVQWASHEAKSCSQQVRQRALGPLSSASDLHDVSRCVAVVLASCTVLEHDRGLSLLSVVMPEVWGHVEGVLRKFLARIPTEVKTLAIEEVSKLAQQQPSAPSPSNSSAASTLKFVQLQSARLLKANIHLILESLVPLAGVIGSEAVALLGPSLYEASQAMVEGCFEGLNKLAPNAYLTTGGDVGSGQSAASKLRARMHPLVHGIQSTLAGLFSDISQDLRPLEIAYGIGSLLDRQALESSLHILEEWLLAAREHDMEDVEEQDRGHADVLSPKAKQQQQQKKHLKYSTTSIVRGAAAADAASVSASVPAGLGLNPENDTSASVQIHRNESPDPVNQALMALRSLPVQTQFKGVREASHAGVDVQGKGVATSQGGEKSFVNDATGYDAHEPKVVFEAPPKKTGSAKKRVSWQGDMSDSVPAAAAAAAAHVPSAAAVSKIDLPRHAASVAPLQISLGEAARYNSTVSSNQRDSTSDAVNEAVHGILPGRSKPSSKPHTITTEKQLSHTKSSGRASGRAGRELRAFLVETGSSEDEEEAAPAWLRRRLAARADTIELGLAGTADPADPALSLSASAQNAEPLRRPDAGIRRGGKGTQNDFPLESTRQASQAGAPKRPGTAAAAAAAAAAPRVVEVDITAGRISAALARAASARARRSAPTTSTIANGVTATTDEEEEEEEEEEASAPILPPPPASRVVRAAADHAASSAVQKLTAAPAAAAAAQGPAPISRSSQGKAPTRLSSDEEDRAVGSSGSSTMAISQDLNATLSRSAVLHPSTTSNSVAPVTRPVRLLTKTTAQPSDTPKFTAQQLSTVSLTLPQQQQQQQPAASTPSQPLHNQAVRPNRKTISLLTRSDEEKAPSAATTAAAGAPREGSGQEEQDVVPPPETTSFTNSLSSQSRHPPQRTTNHHSIAGTDSSRVLLMKQQQQEQQQRLLGSGTTSSSTSRQSTMRLMLVDRTARPPPAVLTTSAIRNGLSDSNDEDDDGGDGGDGRSGVHNMKTFRRSLAGHDDEARKKSKQPSVPNLLLATYGDGDRLAQGGTNSSSKAAADGTALLPALDLISDEEEFSGRVVRRARPISTAK
ncbi:hypothetical protein CEUSTIGMA_g4140.t1 [Chlamydomonas eustigma]|uniref:Uncharacterized protein n=1 Tax=Chlamydomonas eustigma TaxID=1157962 RepID=A0A250X0R8_9CHLO|nr:hypothetical protein CEUSTIGMA_g4140.t1 [Chlamydomonas eustigma]|eukprot:GAX76694.1 hypothetical protein CEUSTIGMA_g4140.t1 [Chlamydomonas eustigma]